METLTATRNPNLRFDPFAEAGDELYDHVAMHIAIEERYRNQEVHHDYTTDKFVEDTEVLVMSAHFNEQFEEMQAILSRMHELCGEDHNLQQQMNGSEVLSAYSRHNENDGHNHASGHGHKKGVDKKESKKKKKGRLSFYEIVKQAMDARKAKAKKK